MWSRIILLFIFFILGRHLGFPVSPRYLELADSADFYIAHENWNRAEEKILQALRLEPANFSNSMLLANLGMVQTNKGEYEKAIETLSLGLNMAPSSTVLLNNRAHANLLMDNLQDAITDLDNSLNIDSIQEWTLQTRAFIFIHNEDYSQAKRLIYKLQKHFPKNKSVLSGLASIAEKEGKADEAIRLYREAIIENEDDTESREALILLLIQADNYSEARNEIRKALDNNPENPVYYLLRGYLHRLNYRLDEAEADKKIAIAKGIDPSIIKHYIP